MIKETTEIVRENKTSSFHNLDISISITADLYDVNKRSCPEYYTTPMITFKSKSCPHVLKVPIRLEKIFSDDDIVRSLGMFIDLIKRQ